MKAIARWFKNLSSSAKLLLVICVSIVGMSAVSAATNPAPQNPTKQKDNTQKIEKKTITESSPISFEKNSVNDENLAQGTTKITTVGVNGNKKITYEITLVDGVQTKKKKIKEEVTVQPVTEITSIGTYVAPPPEPEPEPPCDPNYSGACVPIASDVDCASGSGNGPAYVGGPVYVTGSDIYGLDRDGDGVGCE